LCSDLGIPQAAINSDEPKFGYMEIHAAMNVSETIYLVEDDAELRARLFEILTKSNYHTIAFESALQFVEHYQTDQPGCLVLDIDMPTMNGLELQQELKRRQCTIPIVFITGYGDVDKTVQALKAGAVNFLEKPFRHHLLIESIESALNEDRQVRALAVKNLEIRERFTKLTDRENEILELVVSSAGRLSNKEIANQLGISYRTVDQHRARIKEKTAASSVAELCLLANKIGLVSSEL